MAEDFFSLHIGCFKVIRKHLFFCEGNEGEAQLVCAQVDALVKLGVQQDQIAVITPYNLQVSLCI